MYSSFKHITQHAFIESRVAPYGMIAAFFILHDEGVFMKKLSVSWAMLALALALGLAFAGCDNGTTKVASKRLVTRQTRRAP